MTPSSSPVDRLRTDHPEWQPWLAVVEEVLRETSASAWQQAAAATSVTRHATSPLLAGATLSVAPEAIHRLFDRLVETASRAGTRRMATLEVLRHAEVDQWALFDASLRQDDDGVKEVAGVRGVDPESLHAVTALLAVPFLLACNRAWAPEIPAGWVEPYCPVCGAWPAFVEVRGIDRTRCFRCARCGSEWHARLLRCPYCGMDDHHGLVTLTPQDAATNRAIEACARCLGYVKTVTTLAGCPPGSVMIEDLASVALDLAALDLGYARPPGAGFRFTVSKADEAGCAHDRHPECDAAIASR